MSIGECILNGGKKTRVVAQENIQDEKTDRLGFISTYFARFEALNKLLAFSFQQECKYQ